MSKRVASTEREAKTEREQVRGHARGKDREGTSERPCERGHRTERTRRLAEKIHAGFSVARCGFTVRVEG